MDAPVGHRHGGAVEVDDDEVLLEQTDGQRPGARGRGTQLRQRADRMPEVDEGRIEVGHAGTGTERICFRSADLSTSSSQHASTPSRAMATMSSQPYPNASATERYS